MPIETPDRRHYLALAVVTAGALLFEATLIRLLSVATWYPFAYAAITTAMLGFGGAAVAVATSRRLRQISLANTLRGAAIAMALASLLGYPLWNALPFAPMSLATDPWQILWTLLVLILLTLPFVCAGLFVSRLFAAAPLAAPWLYAADLGGAAAGVILYCLLVPLLGGPGTLAVVAVLGVIAAFLLSDALPVRAALALFLVALLGAAPAIEEIVPLRISPNKLLGTEVARSRPRGMTWNLASTIDVIPAATGSLIVIDGGTAMTLAPRGPARHAARRPPPPTGLRSLAFALGPGRRTLVIGSGGGAEVYAALGARSQEIVAVEIDGAINDLVQSQLSPLVGGIFSHPSVELHTAEARSFLASRPARERYDAILAFHTISNAASQSGAMSLAESYLLTVEAMALLLSRLSEDGVLVISRPEAQIGRLAATIAAAWDSPGDLRDRVAVVTHSQTRPAFLCALVLRRRAFDAAAIDTLERATPGRVLYTPQGGELSEYLGAILTRGDPAAMARAAELAAGLAYPAATLEPVTDSRPFFNLHRPWSALGLEDFKAVLGAGSDGRTRLEDRPVAQVATLLLLAVALLLGSLLVLPAARALRRTGLGTRRAWTSFGAFAGLGFSYIVVEVVLMQISTRIVGEPAWSMLTVLAVVLAASGAGSLIFAGSLRWSPARGALVAGAAALLVAFVVPVVVDLVAPLPLGARLLVNVLMVALVGLALGIPFAAALARIQDASLVAWAWAANSLLSIGGSIGALILSSALGFPVAALAAALVYGGVAWLFFTTSHRESASG